MTLYKFTKYTHFFVNIYLFYKIHVQHSSKYIGIFVTDMPFHFM